MDEIPYTLSVIYSISDFFSYIENYIDNYIDNLIDNNIFYAIDDRII